MAGGACIRA
ncbi:uncharacterized protein FFM5_04987 [Fusarium fujikuroi]|nr:uncharacterized protein FFM5_04987 [Fusarium fujikuroi]